MHPEAHLLTDLLLLLLPTLVCPPYCSAMMAEAVHSLVDIANQMLLRVGLNKSQKRPNEVHPYGYARDQFIWPLISAVGIFCCGAGISMIHGIQGLFEARELGDLYWNFVGE